MCGARCLFPNEAVLVETGSGQYLTAHCLWRGHNFRLKLIFRQGINELLVFYRNIDAESPGLLERAAVQDCAQPQWITEGFIIRKVARPKRDLGSSRSRRDVYERHASVHYPSWRFIKIRSQG